MKPHIGALPPKAGDWFLLCSDGLLEGLWEKHLAREFGEAQKGRAPAEVMRNLMEKSLEESGRDNISLVAIKIA